MNKKKSFWKTLKERWSNKMPKFFTVLFVGGTFVSGTALAINTACVAAGAALPDWWNEIYAYLIGIPAGMAFAAKFTQSYDAKGKPVTKKEDK